MNEIVKHLIVVNVHLMFDGDCINHLAFVIEAFHRCINLRMPLAMHIEVVWLKDTSHFIHRRIVLHTAGQYLSLGILIMGKHWCHSYFSPFIMAAIYSAYPGSFSTRLRPEMLLGTAFVFACSRSSTSLSKCQLLYMVSNVIGFFRALSSAHTLSTCSRVGFMRFIKSFASSMTHLGRGLAPYLLSQ